MMSPWKKTKVKVIQVPKVGINQKKSQSCYREVFICFSRNVKWRKSIRDYIIIKLLNEENTNCFHVSCICLSQARSIASQIPISYLSTDIKHAISGKEIRWNTSHYMCSKERNGFCLFHKTMVKTFTKSSVLEQIICIDCKL